MTTPHQNESTWMAFHRANACMYRAVSDVDRDHHHELRYWAGHEERKPEEVAAKIQEQQAETR